MKRWAKPNSLSIVIPAFNEEKGIGGTIEQCMAARTELAERTPISDVELLVVNDGSTDGTADIARSYSGVTVIECQKNRGYGAALKLGFEKSAGDLVGFLDADGTCDPYSFVDLCNLAIDGPADVVLGSRMHKESKMPLIRKLGNRMFAIVMSYFSGEKVTDIASGMRVVRREALSSLYPLPNGLHFTPAMSSKALLDNNLTIRETPIPYHERTGSSKLDVIKDGARFFLTIGRILYLHFSLRLFGGIALVLFLLALFYGMGPFHFYLAQHSIPDSYIYRLITVNTLILAGLMFLSIGIIAERVAAALNGGRPRKHRSTERFLLTLFSTKNMLIAGPLIAFLGVAINAGSIYDYLTTWHIGYHWVYITTGALLVLSGTQLTALGIFNYLISVLLAENGGEAAKASPTPPH